MKIAFFSPKPFSPQLGATKNRIEMAAALEVLGWSTFLIDSEEVFEEYGIKDVCYKEALKNYLIRYAHRFNVILYEYDSLPFRRELFCKQTLFIARPALLFFSDTAVNDPIDYKTRLSIGYKRLVNFFKFRTLSDQKKQDQEKMKSLQQSDLIQVQNSKDMELLVQKGFKRTKVIIVPNGVTNERRKQLQKDQKIFKGTVTIAFVGTFDFRKGALDFPYIVGIVLKSFPSAKFRFLGTKGLFITKDQVLRFFPKKQHKALEVIPDFSPELLPKLLKGCQIGIFPSYLESFGFGVLEMMCAGIPVISYNIPGPSDFVPQELLIPKGNKKLMSKKVLELIKDRRKLLVLSEKVRTVTIDYNWTKICQRASRKYLKHYKKLLSEHELVFDGTGREQI